MIIALYIVAAVIMAIGSLYFAWQNKDFRKFLAGAFFVSSGTLFYLYLADVSVPLLGTSFETDLVRISQRPAIRSAPLLRQAKDICSFSAFLLSIDPPQISISMRERPKRIESRG